MGAAGVRAPRGAGLWHSVGPWRAGWERAAGGPADAALLGLGVAAAGALLHPHLWRGAGPAGAFAAMAALLALVVAFALPAH